MKQHITTKQLNELSDAAKAKLNEVWRNNGQVINLLNHEDITIGTMMEFLISDLHEYDYMPDLEHNLFGWELSGKYPYGKYKTDQQLNDELCDGLWKIVKKTLKEIKL